MAGPVIIDPRNAMSFASTDPEISKTLGSGFSGKSILYGDRYIDLDRKQSYYDCTQHSWKVFDFDGRMYNPRTTMPFISEKTAGFVPLRMRRPNAPYRLGKIIVDAFTTLIFGENRFPSIRVDGDPDTEDFQQTLARVGRLPLKMIQARNLGGSMGTVAMSWSFRNGLPRYEVHNAKNLHVHTWEDRAALIPRHTSEVYLFYKSKWDGRQFTKIHYWFRRDWTPTAEIIFKEQPYDPQREPVWEIDDARTVAHQDNVPHLVWIQNLPTDEIDGAADYDGLYDSFDTIDILKSVIVRGATLNLDPTLKLKMDPALVNKMGIKKGSDNALVVGEGGDAAYLELSGQSVTAGKELLELMRRAILETAQCIVPDPHEVAAQGVSSVTIKALYAQMLGAADVRREQYGSAIEKLVDYPTQVARERMSTSVFFSDPEAEDGVKKDPETGAPVEGKFTLSLPPKIEELPPPLDPITGKPAIDPETGEPPEPEHEKIPRVPGEGGEINLRWPPYFSPTPDDQNKIVTNMQLATGGKAFNSKETATEITAAAYGIDPEEEKKRVEQQGHQDKADMAAMTPPGMGGEVDDPNDLPPGANPGKKPNPFANGAPPGGDDDGLDADRGG